MDTLVIDTDVWSFWFKGDTRGAPYRALATDKTLFISAFRRRGRGASITGRRSNTGECDGGGSWFASCVSTAYWSTTTRPRIVAQLRAECHQQGLPISAQDAWIAASALRHS